MQYIQTIYRLVVVGNQKAIVGFVVTFILTFLAQFNISAEMTMNQALESLVYAVIGAAGVWLKANK